MSALYSDSSKKNHLNNERTANQTNRFIHSSMDNIKPGVYKLLLAAIALCEPTEFPHVTISEKQLVSILGLENTLNKGYGSYIRKIAIELRNWGVELQNQLGLTVHQGVVNKVLFDGNNIILEFDMDIRSEISLINTNNAKFAPIQIKNCTHLSSVSKMKLYQALFVHHWKKEKIKAVKYTLFEDLEIIDGDNSSNDILFLLRILNVNKKTYNRWSLINQKIISKAVKDINRFTNIKIHEVITEKIKHSRKIGYVTFKFEITKLNEISNFLPKKTNSDLSKVIKILKDYLISYGMSEDTANKFIIKHTPFSVGVLIGEVESQVMINGADYINNKAGYITSLISNIEEITPNNDLNIRNTHSFKPIDLILAPLLSLHKKSISDAIPFIPEFQEKRLKKDLDTLAFYNFLKERGYLKLDSQIFIHSEKYSKTSPQEEAKTNKKNTREIVNKKIRNIYDTSW